MENENMNIIEQEEATPVTETVDFIEQDAEVLADEMVVATDRITQKCREIKELCAKTANRIADDWRETNGNPYIRQTHTYKVEVFRKPGDTTPVDTFQMTDVKSYSLRALALATGIAAVLFCASGNIVKKLFTPGE